MVYEVLDYENEDRVDFVKFCLLNTDKSNDIFRLIDEFKRAKLL